MGINFTTNQFSSWLSNLCSNHAEVHQDELDLFTNPYKQPTRHYHNLAHVITVDGDEEPNIPSSIFSQSIINSIYHLSILSHDTVYLGIDKTIDPAIWAVLEELVEPPTLIQTTDNKPPQYQVTITASDDLTKMVGIMVNCGSLKSVVIVYGIALAREVFICTK